MALKGFLASGFQKLIGASRIKGADESWLGEHNVQDVSSNTVPIAATLAPGLNIIRYTGGSDFDFTGGSSPLFSTIPTHATQVIFINKSVSAKKMIFETAAINGGLIVHSTPLVLLVGGSVTFWYDVTQTRWRESARTGCDISVFTQTFNATGGLNYLGDEAERVFIVNTTGDYNITGCSPYGLATPAGRKLTIVGSNSLPTNFTLTVQQNTGVLGDNSKFYINGDFVLSPSSSITMLQTGDGWVEISRSSLSY